MEDVNFIDYVLLQEFIDQHVDHTISAKAKVAVTDSEPHDNLVLRRFRDNCQKRGFNDVGRYS